MVPLLTMLRRNLIYTAVPQGKKLVVIVGQPKALALAVKGSQTRRRWSKLAEWLGDESEAVPGRQQAWSDELRHHLW